MTSQLDMFVVEVPAEVGQRSHWRSIWGWGGPTVGGMCEVGSPIVPKAEGGSVYAYLERARLIEQQDDGRWLAEIAMGEVRGQPWWKDGTRVLLRPLDIDPPRCDLRASRSAA